MHHASLVASNLRSTYIHTSPPPPRPVFTSPFATLSSILPPPIAGLITPPRRAGIHIWSGSSPHRSRRLVLIIIPPERPCEPSGGGALRQRRMATPPSTSGTTTYHPTS